MNKTRRAIAINRQFNLVEPIPIAKTTGSGSAVDVARVNLSKILGLSFVCVKLGDKASRGRQIASFATFLKYRKGTLDY